MPTPARSLADDLRSRSDEQLVALLTRRPDLARPAPADLTTLAARATTRSSVQQALDRLTLAHLQTLEAVIVAAPATPAEVAALLDRGARSPVVRRLLHDLIELALCWRSDEGIRPARTVSEVIGDPAGLGPTLPDVPPNETIVRALGRLTSSQLAVVDALRWGPPTAVVSNGATPAARATADLIRAGLLRRVDDETVLVPRQVGLAMRGGVLHRTPRLDPPTSRGVERDMAGVDAAAGGRAAQVLSLVHDLIDAWGQQPPPVLRSGGLGVRDLTRLATELEIGTAQAAWLVEVLAAAGLIAHDSGVDPHWLPTHEADAWSQLGPGNQWGALAAAWWTMPAGPSLVRSGSGSERVNALTVQTSWPAGRRRRQDVLRALTSLPVGAGPTTSELLDVVRWHHPLRAAVLHEDDLEVILTEAEWSGVLAVGAVSTAGRALITYDAEAAATAMAEHVAAPVDRVLLQADLTAVAMGRLDGQVRSVLLVTADVESRGGATVHRFSESSLRRAFDAGWSVDRTLAELAAISATPLPQPLRYLVADVARRHGAIRLGSASTYLRADDPPLLDAVAADRRLSVAQWHRIAPTVLVSPVDPTTVLELLREHGYAPVADQGGAAAAALLSPSRRRTSAPTARPVHSSSLDAAATARVIAAMRAGENARAEASLPGAAELSVTDPAVSAERARVAAAEGEAIWVGYADDAGGVRRLLFWPDRVEAGRVHGHVDGQSRSRTLALHRVTGVAPVS